MINIIKLKIFGRVQRVFFRVFTQRKARELDLTGWVKNELDGTVSIVAEGDEEKLNKLINWAKKGPLLAKVTNVEIKWEQGEQQYKDFQITK